MSFEATAYAVGVTVGSAPEKLIFLLLANNANQEDGYAYPSIKYLSDRSELDRKTVVRALNSLREKGLIHDTGERRGVTKSVIVYRLDGFPDYPKIGKSQISSTENGTASKDGEAVPFFPISSTVFPPKQSQKRDREPISKPINNQLAKKSAEKAVDKNSENPNLVSEDIVNHAKAGERGWNPEAYEGEILPGGWYDMAARKFGGNDEAIYKCWGRFKQVAVKTPPSFFTPARWRAWLANEGRFIATGGTAEE